jgi:hypothetical protein
MAVGISETWASFCNSTLRNVPGDYYLHSRSLENLKSHEMSFIEISADAYFRGERIWQHCTEKLRSQLLSDRQCHIILL